TRDDGAHRRAGPDCRACGSRPGLLPYGRPGDAERTARRTHPRPNPSRLFRSLVAMTFANTIIQGILLGGLYALYAAGLSLIFGVMRLVNLAHGDFIVLAAYVILALSSALFIPPFFALLIALPFLFALGWGLQRVMLNRTLVDNLLVPLLVTFGQQIIIQKGLLQVFSADSRRISTGDMETASIQFLGISIGVMPLLTFIAAVAVIGGLSALFYMPAMGRKLRATSDSAQFV